MGNYRDKERISGLEVPEVKSSDFKVLDPQKNIYMLSGEVVTGNYFIVGNKYIFHVDGRHEAGVEIIEISEDGKTLKFQFLD